MLLVSFIHSFIHAFRSSSYDRPIASSKPSSLSISSTLWLPYGHSVAAYVFFLVFPSLLLSFKSSGVYNKNYGAEIGDTRSMIL